MNGANNTDQFEAIVEAGYGAAPPDRPLIDPTLKTALLEDGYFSHIAGLLTSELWQAPAAQAGMREDLADYLSEPNGRYGLSLAGGRRVVDAWLQDYPEQEARPSGGQA